jgi:hypothetical protein
LLPEQRNMADVLALESAASIWEGAGYVCTALVLIGVIGETLAEFRPTTFRSNVTFMLGRISALLLIIGISGEILTQVKANNLNGKVISILDGTTETLRASNLKLALDLESERQKTAPRPWTKDQFDALQTLRGKLPDVGIAWERSCTECMIYAGFIQTALHEAGAQIHQDNTYDPGMFSSDTGIEIVLPATADLSSDPIVIAFKAAGLNPWTRHHVGEFSTIRTDIPVVVVGERFRPYVQFPFSPPCPNGGCKPYESLPLKKQ